MRVYGINEGVRRPKRMENDNGNEDESRLLFERETLGMEWMYRYRKFLPKERIFSRSNISDNEIKLRGIYEGV